MAEIHTIQTPNQLSCLPDFVGFGHSQPMELQIRVFHFPGNPGTLLTLSGNQGTLLNYLLKGRIHPDLKYIRLH